ncbi:MAG: type II toxin-antitoxin system RelE/ParE family toxin [Acetobacteraceae bacterium]
MIGLSARAARQFRELREHYEDRERPEATRRLIAALEEASRKIEVTPSAGLAAPRPYPHLARPDRLWIKAGRYWIAYQPATPVIVGVFYETANIPRRL